MPCYTFISARLVDVLICQICDADMLKSFQTARALARASASNCVPVNVDGMTSPSPSNAIHRNPRLEWLLHRAGTSKTGCPRKSILEFWSHWQSSLNTVDKNNFQHRQHEEENIYSRRTFRNRWTAEKLEVRLTMFDQIATYSTWQVQKAIRGPSIVVGIATVYGLDGPRIESRWGRDFPHLSRPALRPTQPPVKWVSGLSRGQGAAGAWRWPLTPF